jgi:hypothetical protein
MSRFAMAFAIFACIAAASSAQAQQREVRWQINTLGFPDNVSVFVDVQEGPSFTRNLPATAFALSMDDSAGEEGGWIMNQAQQIAGQAGGRVLIMIDRSRSYTGEFERAKKFAKDIIRGMDTKRDQVAIATFPAMGGYAEAKLEFEFSNSVPALESVIDRIALPPKDDETGARICDSLNEGLKFFGDTVKDKYRTVIFVTGGADKGEGKGDCVQQSYAAGKVPFYSIGFPLDRKYDDPRNAHKIENGLYDLAQKTGGQSSYRRTDSEIAQFVTMFWYRIRAQYQLQVNFPCFKPAPAIEHVSMLKVEGRDTEGIQFQATSAQAPVPAITALYPAQGFRNDVDDGKVDLTIDGRGFCGGTAGNRVAVNNAPVQAKSANPFRLVASLNSTVDTGTVKITNRFGQTGESLVKFEVVKPPKGAEASSTLTVLVILLVGLVVVAVIVVALRSRKAKVVVRPPAPAPAPAPPSPHVSTAPRTVALSGVSGAFVVRVDGSRVELVPGQNLIGREPHCKIKLEVAGVSREHARIDLDVQANQIWITDLGSTNGTYLGPKDGPQSGAVRLAARTQWTQNDAVWIGGDKLLAVIEGAPKEG